MDKLSSSTKLKQWPVVVNGIIDQVSKTASDLSDLDESLATVAKSGAYGDLSGTPTSLKNPAALTVKNSASTTLVTYDGSGAETLTLNATAVGLGNVDNESKATMFSSAALTGKPTAPTAAAGTNTTQIATTAFVQAAVSQKADITGNAGSADKLASSVTISLSGDVTGSVTFDGSEDVSISAVVADDSHNHTIANVDNLQTTLDGKAPLASPTLTGTPKAPTAAAGTNTTQIATTAFVTTAVANKTSVASATKATQDASGNVITTTYATKGELEAASTAANSYTDTAIANLVDSAPDTLNTLGELATALSENVEVTEALNEAIGSKANDSAVVKLTGNQTIAGTKTFSSTISGSVSGNAGTATKLASAVSIALTGDVTGSVDFDGSEGVSITATVADDSHNHTIANIDSLQTTLNAKAALASPTFTGTPKAPTATAGTNTTQIATTAFVTTAAAAKVSGPSESTANHVVVFDGTTGKLVKDSGFTLGVSVPADAKFTDTDTTYTAGTGLSLSTDNAFSLATHGTAGSYGPSANATPAFGATFNVPYVTTDAYGRASAATKTVKIPSTAMTAATSSAAGATGLVPAPAAGAQSKFLRGDATWQSITTNKVAQNVSTATTNHPILACATAGATANNTNTTIFASTITINPSAGSLTANAVYNAVWNDYAEFFPRGGETEAGDFVGLSLDSNAEVYVKASKETSRAVGIHSDSYGHLIGGETPPDDIDFVEYNMPKFIPVGLCGRVMAKIDGPIKKGDFVVISEIPGVGRAYIPGTDEPIDIIGMACESSSDDSVKRIKVKIQS